MKKAKKEGIWKKILIFSSKTILCVLITASVILVWQHKIRPANASGKASESAAADAVLEARIDYYESRVAALESDLLDAKKQLYIAETDYRALLHEYEEFLLSVQSAQESKPTAEPTQSENAEDAPPASSSDVNPISPPTVPISEDENEILIHYVVEKGGITVTDCAGGTGDLVIPSRIADLPVTSIAEGAFRSCRFSSVVLPPSVIEVGWFAFADSPSLRFITLPGSVSEIGYEAFAGCPSLVLICPADSYAARYAASYGIPRKDPS